MRATRLPITALFSKRRFMSLIGALATALAFAAVPGVAADRAGARANVKGGARQGMLRPAAAFGQQEFDEGYRPTKFRATQEDFNRYAHDAAPKPLTSAQIDRDTGRLFWPRVLMDYDDLRDELDRLFAERAKVNGAIGNRMYAGTLEKIKEMFSRLAASAPDVRGCRGTRNYCEARNFLESLAYELDYVVPPDVKDNE